ncbi:MAG: hypothetical protein H6611_04600 [Ignavibacteriales bacterium]|nr:hypothetical protein [Ignavibacteriales bacterium]
MKKPFLLNIFFHFIITSLTFGQANEISITKIDSFRINFQNKYELSGIHIIPGSEKIQIGKRNLNTQNYEINYHENSISLIDTLTYSIFDTLFVEYQSYFLNLQKIYRHRKLVQKYDDKFQDTISIVKNTSVDLSTRGIFGKDLQSSGTLLRGFSLGTNKDLTVNSGLRLQLSGKISEEIEIVAALTDENTPIQPEGNTERLEELDKVFIEIKHKNASGTFGDYNYQTNIGEFGRIERKLQGVLGKVKIDDYGGGFSFASSRGKFNSMELNGIDGVQGPYRLYGSDNENDIIVIAGSEKVYLDGRQLKRGENNDYIIEYSNGELTFTPKIIITNLSRIIVDFEYTNRQYDRNVLGANAFGSFFKNNLKIQVNAFQEGDNKNSPIDIALSDKDKVVLEQNGDDKLAASTSGVIEVADDSLGIYSIQDTVINGNQLTIYLYNPGASSAKYNVTFSYVGEGNGDYKRESLGKFNFVGINQGAYLPIRLLPLPETVQMGNIVIDYSPIHEINLNFELAASSFDRNTFSSIDDNDNNGFANVIKFDVNPISLNISGKDYGKISGSFKNRIKDEKFRSIDRINEIEFERNYNTTNSTSNQEKLQEFKLNYVPIEEISLSSQYGLLKRGNNFESERILAEVKADNYKNFNFLYDFDNVDTKLRLQNSSWLRQNGRISYNLWKVQPGIEFRSENKEEKLNSVDSLLLSSLQFYEYAPFMLFSLTEGLILTTKYSFTNEKVPENGLLVDESKTYAHSYSLLFREWRELTSEIDFSFRKKKYSELFNQKGFGNNESVQIRSQNQIRLFDRLLEGNIYYQTSSERSAKLERVFVRVPQGTGSYSYQGDLNNNGIAEENEFVIDPYEGDFIQTTIPTDELFPVIDLKFNTRWKIEFDKYFDDSNLLNNVLSSLSSETTYRVEENSKVTEPEKIYLMNFKYFLNDSTTIRGFNYFQQDVHIFKNERDLSFRLRFTERNSLNQYSSGLENAYSKERSVRIKFRMVKEINNETEFSNNIENVLAPVNSNRSRQTVSNNVSSDFSYRPYDNFELGFIFKVGRLQDNYPENPTIIDENKISLRLTLSLSNLGRLRVEAERTELLTNTNENVIPFEITNGNLIGKNYIWRANFDYRFSSNLQTTINYSGRLQGKGKVINTFTAEARAYF